MFSLRSSSAIWTIYLGRLKVKVTLEGQTIKWSGIELVLAISSVFKHVFQNNLAHLYSLKCHLKHLYIMFIPPSPYPSLTENKKKKKDFLDLDSLPMYKTIH